jgi:hypothetical protein
LQGNPVSYRTYAGVPYKLDIDTRRVYENVSEVGVGNLPVHNDLSVYPNPAGDKLFVKGISEGRYKIQNMAGQVLQRGTVVGSLSVPVGSLTPGIYFINIQDKHGVVHATQFIRQ